MPALTETPTTGPLASIIKATQRLNPCFELDVDVLAVTRAAVASTPADWNAGTLTATSPDTKTGVLRLTPTTPAILFSQTAGNSVHHLFKDSVDGVEEYALDFFPDPSVTQGVSFTLDSLDLYLSAGNLKGFFRVIVAYYDQNWRVVPMGDPIDILSGDVIIAVGSGGVYRIDFTALGRKFVFPGGMQNTVTGTGLTSGGVARTSNIDAKGVSHLLNIPRGLSISIQPMGRNFTSAYIGLVANATAAQFDTTAFWRAATNRNCGPYNPDNQPYTGGTTDKNPDNYLITGAVPGFGAKAVTNGSWGIARRIPTAQRAQSSGGAQTWEQPYHVLRVLAYPSTGTAVNVLDLGAVPTNPVELRLDDWQQQGTGLAYVLKGSNISGTGAWTAISANTDGSILTGADLYRWYQLTTTFTPGPSGAIKYASPALQAWSMVERVALSTYRYLKDFDSTVVADPVTAQSSIGELKLPVMNAGRQDFRDLASQLGSNYAPSGLEAHVYARNTRSGVRYFLNSYRLENRDPQFGIEEMTFVSGMDRLTVKIPTATETYRYPSSGQVAIANVTNAGAVYTIYVSGTPFTLGALAGYRMHGVTGTCAGIDYAILSSPANTTSAFAVNIAAGAIPAIGDTFEIHSDITTRMGAAYVSQDFAVVYNDLLAVQAAVPARYRGRLPATTGRTTSYTLPADGIKALEVLQDVALHCGGFPAWDKGRIQFVDLYGKKDSVATWDDRHIASLETPLGADRRMPRVRVKYGYQPDTQKFTNHATYDDFDTMLGWALPNLFDIFEAPDNLCKWCDVVEAKWLADTLQKAWKSGVRLWKVKTIFYYPHLSQGDAVTIMTDQYTDRRLSYSADGVTDLGTPVAGRTASVAVIVGKNLWGNEFVVAVRGLDQVTSQAVATTGTVTVPLVGTQVPIAIITPLNTESDDTIWNLRFSATAGSGGGGANLTYIVKSKAGFATDTTLSSGNASAFPLDLAVTRDLRVTKQLRFIVTDTLTGLTSTATFAIPSRRSEIDGSGRFKRAQSYDDGDYSIRGTTSDGFTSHTSHKEFGGKRIGRLLGKVLDSDADSLDGLPEGTSYKRVTANAISGGGNVDFTLSGFTGKNVDNIADTGTYRRTTLNEATGGGRGYTQLHTNGYLDGSSRIPAPGIAGSWSRQVVSAGDRNDLGAAHMSSSGHTISIGAWTLIIGAPGNTEGVVNYNASTCSDVAFGVNYVFCDDPTFAGGAVTYFATTQQSYVSNLPSHVYVGKITTAAGAGTGAGSGGPICVAPETMILVCDRDGERLREKKAGNIRAGDFVWTAPDSNPATMGAYEVMHAEIIPNQIRAEVLLDDGRMLVCSAKHRLRLAQAWREAVSLKPGEVVIGNPLGVVKLAHLFDRGPVVRLTVAHAQTYISAGLLSHNVKPL